MRLVLVLVLIHGLIPGLAEVGEAIVHYARTGHVAHTAADRGDLGDQGAEHGCGITHHRCTCCATQLIVQSTAVAIASVSGGGWSAAVPSGRALAPREPDRPFRPPIS